MATGFDPYHKWLAIPPGEQPPNLYRLLGLDLFESDPDVIDTAANARMTHLRSLQHSRHANLSQELLNKVAAAQHCLLKPEKKADYDAELRAQIAWKTASQALPIAAGTTANLQPVFVSQSVPRDGSAADPFDFLSATDRPVAARRDLAASKAILAQAKRRTQSRWLIALAPILGIAVVIGAVLIHNSWDADDADAKPNPNRVSTALVHGGQAPSSVHGSASAGEPSVAKPQKVTGEDEGPKESSASAGREALDPSKPTSPTAGVDNTEPHADVPQNSVTDDGSAKSARAAAAPSVSAQSNGQFPLGQRVDVLRLSDTTRDAVRGRWSRAGNEITVEPLDRARIAIPVAVEGSYDLEVEFTRTEGNGDVNTLLSIGPHPCMVTLSAFGGGVSGLANGRDLRDPNNPVVVRPGRLENNHRYRLLVSARIDSEDHASVDVSLDGKAYLPHWEGNPAALSQPADWTMPNPTELGLGAYQNNVTFHSARLTMRSGSATLDPALISVNRSPAFASSSSGSDPNLSGSHPEQSTVGESWAARAKELIRSGSSRKTPDGRTEIVRSALGLLNQADGADLWSSQALELVKLAETVGRQTNEGPLIADWLRATEARIRRAKTIADGATGARDTLAKKADNPDANTILGGFLCFQVDKWEEGLPHLAKGSDPSLKRAAESEQTSPSESLDQFKLANTWWDAANKLPGVKSNPWFAPIRARAAYWYRKCGSGVAGPAQAMAQKRIAEEDAAKAELAALADGQFPLPLGRPIDVLRLVDTNGGMVVAGSWSRDGQEISVAPGKDSRIMIPVVIKGSYELEVDFTRTSDRSALWTYLPIGSHSCTVRLSDGGGNGSGLAMLNGFGASDPRNPTAVRPGNLQNGHRYRLLVSAQVDSDDHASIDVSLDGRPYLPHWAGDPAVVSPAPDWPNPSELGLGANGCAVTFHSARLRMLSASASLDSALISANR